MKDLLNLLEDTARFKAQHLDPAVFLLRGVWKCQYVLQLTQEESIFNLNYIIAQTIGQGCCYFEAGNNEPTINEGLIGRNIQENPIIDRVIRIAALDAIFSSINGLPDESQTINGTNFEKAHQRAEIVCRETLNLLNNKPPKNSSKMSVLNVGVVGSFLSILTKQKNLQVKASDFYAGVIGKTIHGITVENGTKKGSSQVGDRTLDLVAESDIAIITGMTLANNTLDGILSTALENKTALVIFAETGANFASEYCKMGADVVVSEPFPFYLTSNGPTSINIYRK